ncbi:MAG TPA: hypothetical protein VFJ74_13850 [Gemmatimonadaceae bacterium]|nr:hypothetical protein [Gemmatimonadaceae bacterium]
MSPLTVVKIALAVAGVAFFGYGVRVDSTTARWVGIGFVAVAAVLRFVRTPASRD